MDLERTLAALVAATLSSLACSGSHAGAGCTIGGVDFPNGTVNSQNACQSCQPTLAKSAWSPLGVGTPCGTGAVCFAGTCQRGCYLSSNFYAEGTPDPHRACQSCQPDRDIATFSPRTDLPPPGQCGVGEICASGACAAGCFIQGQAVEPGQLDPLHPCLACSPQTTVDRYSAAPDGTPCGDDGFSCISGSCEPGCLVDGQRYAASDRDPGATCLVCNPTQSSRAWVPLTGPDPGCGAGQLCLSGACTAGCFIDGGFLPAGLIDPEDPCRLCDSSRTTADWSAFSGIPRSGCNGGQVCAQGQCRIGCFIDGGYLADRTTRSTDVGSCCNASTSPGAWSPSFVQVSDYSILTIPDQIITGDFNGDGRTDLAVGGCDNGSSGSSVMILLNRGGGTLSAPVTLTPSCAVQFIASDLDQDGVSDLVFLHRPGGVPGGTLGVVMNHGDGGFGNEVILPLAEDPWRFGVADLDRDGLPDLVVAEQDINSGASSLEIFFGKGGGAFKPAKVYSLGAPSGLLILADLNLDGAPDLVIAGTNSGGYGEIWLALNDGHGGFGVPQSASLEGRPSALVTGDFDGDGKTDVQVATVDPFELALFPGNGGGGFSRGAIQALPNLAISLVAADLNGDHALDLMITTPDPNPYLAINQGNGTFFDLKPAGPPPSQYGSLVVAGAAVGDFGSGGGAQDLAFLSLTNGGAGYNQGGSTDVSLWLNGCP